MRVLSVLTVLTLVAPSALVSLQEKHVVPAGSKTVTIVPGARYQSGWLHELFFGAHWRSLWATPIEVDVLDLGRFAGGLIPVKRGGGMQTKSLRFLGQDGRQYKFRSIDKDPIKILPADLWETVAVDILQDQISSANPVAALVVAPLLNAVGILNAQPSLVVMPDDDRLGEFRVEFRGLLGTIEEHPDDGSDGEPGFAGAEKVISTFSLFEKMEEDHDHQIDQAEYLKARLMDIFVGDWDRHTDQWRWAGFKENGSWIWKPIPRDRDQAFARFDGLLPWMADLSVAQLNHFSNHYPKIEDLTWSGRYLDRRVLNNITKAAWDSVTQFLTRKLTREVIDSAVRQLPRAMYEKEGRALTQDLLERKLHLPEASQCFYRQMFTYPDVRASDKSEYAEIELRNEKELVVSLYPRSKTTGEKKDRPFYRRVFNSDETKEVRLYLSGGDDRAVVSGNGNVDISLFIDGGEGKDELIDSSFVWGYFLKTIPFIPETRTKTVFYDLGKKTTFFTGPGTKIKEYAPRLPATELEKWEPPVRDYGHDWKFDPWFGISPDDGLFIGGGPILYEFGFHVEPFVYRMELRGGFAIGLRKFRFDYSSEFYELLPGAHVLLHTRISQLEVLNYFGLGNETRFNDELEKNKYNKVKQQQFVLQPSLELNISPSWTIAFGPFLKVVDTESESNTLLGHERPYGSLDVSMAGIRGQLTYDSRNSRVFPSKGSYAEVSGSFFPTLFNLQHPFGTIRAEVRAYLQPVHSADVTIALRMAGDTRFGVHPFFEASYLGGSESLRGYDKQRFAGDASLFGNAEARASVSKYMFIVPTTWGLSAFVETGRVFLSGEPSNRWHSSVGGGVWFSFVEKDFTLSVSIAQSPERLGVFVVSGFQF